MRAGAKCKEEAGAMCKEEAPVLYLGTGVTLSHLAVVLHTYQMKDVPL